MRIILKPLGTLVILSTIALLSAVSFFALRNSRQTKGTVTPPAGVLSVSTPMQPTQKRDNSALNMGGPPVSLENGTMTKGEAAPTLWTTWTKEGRVSLSRDTTTYVNGPASLRLEGLTPKTDGLAAQQLGGKPAGAQFIVHGYFKTSGPVKNCLVGLRVEDRAGEQLQWIGLADTQNAPNWTRFRQSVTLHKDAVIARLRISIQGKGTVWLDEVGIK
jgi:hypothetical protein